MTEVLAFLTCVIILSPLLVYLSARMWRYGVRMADYKFDKRHKPQCPCQEKFHHGE